MFVKDYMFTDVPTAKHDDTLADVVRMMVEDKTNSFIVIDDNNKPIGLVSSHTLIRETVPYYLREDIRSSAYDAEGTFDRYAKLSMDKKLSDIMFKDFHALTEDDAMIEAAAYSLKGARRIFPVVERKTGKLIGAITRTCLKNALYNAIFKTKQIDPKNGGEHRE